MKKYWLLLVVLVCTMLTACKKNTEEDIVVDEINIPGVEVDDLTCAYDYSYSEQQNGNLLFTIKGEWASNQTWKAEYDQDVIAEVKEVSKSDKEVQFEFSPKGEKGGYSEYFIELYDTDTQEIQYTFAIPLMLSENGKKISVLSISFYTSSEEEVTKSDEQEENIETALEEEKLSETQKQEVLDALGEIEIPTEIEITEAYVKEITDRKKGEQYGEMIVTYEGIEYQCVIAPNTPLSYFQKVIEAEEHTKEIQYINDVEITVYSIDKVKITMWKSESGERYILTEKNNSGGNSLKVAEILINK